MSLVMLLSLTMWGCNKAEKAKGEDKKENKQTVNKQTVNKASVPAQRSDDIGFNHAASIKMANALSQVPGIANPVIVVQGEEAIIAYQSPKKQKGAEDSARKKLKKAMPAYRIHFISDPDNYHKMKLLYQDTIESEGRTTENLGDHFNQLKPK